MEQLILHLVGDYITQSDWMANGKTARVWPALVHATVYSLPFLLLRPSVGAFAVILFTHLLIDHYRLAKYIVWAKNSFAPFSKMPPPYYVCKDNFGYPPETPVWLAAWLMIIADNTMHLSINYLSLKFL